MKNLTRRQFLKTSGLSIAMMAGASTFPSLAAESKRRVVVIGGGWGGATAAKYIRLSDPSIEVTLLEPNKEFISCPFSNLVLAGVENLKNLTMNYTGLRKHGVQIRRIDRSRGQRLKFGIVRERRAVANGHFLEAAGAHHAHAPAVGVVVAPGQERRARR